MPAPQLYQGPTHKNAGQQALARSQECFHQGDGGAQLAELQTSQQLQVGACERRHFWEGAAATPSTSGSKFLPSPFPPAFKSGHSELGRAAS